MRRERAAAWTVIIVVALLIGFGLGRCTAPDGAGEVDGEPAAATSATEVPAPQAPAPAPAPPPAVVQSEPAPTVAPPEPAAPTRTPTPRPTEQRYVVASGDTLNQLAVTFYGDGFCFDELAALNGLDPSAGLRIGQELLIASQGDCTPI